MKDELEGNCTRGVQVRMELSEKAKAKAIGVSPTPATPGRAALKTDHWFCLGFTFIFCLREKAKLEFAVEQRSQ